MITSAWIDTETTGKDPREFGAFEISLLVYQGAKCVFEKLYHLNPLNDEVKWGEEAYQIHGVKEETIRSYPPPEEVIPDIVADLKKYMPPEKYVFAGYNCNFDYGHIGALFFRAGFNVGDYFNNRPIDVYDRVKKAAAKGLLPKTENQRLETMTKALGINHEKAHSAMDDIKATRQLYEVIWQLDQQQQGGQRT
jgi:DNA polymerase III epsilon subunit-like protein